MSEQEVISDVSDILLRILTNQAKIEAALDEISSALLEL